MVGKRVAGVPREPRRPLGRPLAVLEIPKLGLVVPVLEGTDELTLNRGVGHIAGTALPGGRATSGSPVTATGSSAASRTSRSATGWSW